MSAAENIAAMDDIDLMDCVIGIADRVFEPGHPNELALREMAERYWRGVVERIADEVCGADLAVEVGERYFTPEHAPTVKL